MRNRPLRLAVELTPAEKSALLRQALAAGEKMGVRLTQSEYVRWLIRQRAQEENPDGKI